jgi:AcrR family transcriptional regulator
MSRQSWGEEIQSRDEQYRLKRKALLRTAACAFNEHGFHKTSLSGLAERLHVSKPTLYHYIKSKDEILYECQKMAVDHLRDVLDTIHTKDLTGIEKLKLLIQRYVEAVTDDFGICMVLSGDFALEPDSRTAITEQRRVLDSAMREIIKQGVEDGSLVCPDPKMAAFALFGAINWISHWYRADGDLTPEEIAKDFTTIVLDGLLPRDSSTQSG